MLGYHSSNQLEVQHLINLVLAWLEAVKIAEQPTGHDEPHDNCGVQLFNHQLRVWIHLPHWP